jgi:hypothetical protein
MKIDRQNYEAYFLDYIEGKLDAAEIARLMEFILQNPDLKFELEHFQQVTLEPAYEMYPEKKLLKKNSSDLPSVYEVKFDELCISKIEEQLDKKTLKLFDYYLQQHPAKSKEFDFYSKTILKPDTNTIFENKRKLKHYKLNHHRITLYHIAVAAASVIILVLALKFDFGFQKTENNRVTGNLLNRQPVKTYKNISVNKTFTDIHKVTKVSNIELRHNPAVTKVNHETPQFKRSQTSLQMQKGIEIGKLNVVSANDSPVISAYLKEACLAEMRKNRNDEKRFLYIDQLAENEIKKVLKDQNVPVEKELTLWTLAKSGIMGLNRLMGSNILLESKNDTATNRSRFELDTGVLGFYSSLEKK